MDFCLLIFHANRKESEKVKSRLPFSFNATLQSHQLMHERASGAGPENWGLVEEEEEAKLRKVGLKAVLLGSSEAELCSGGDEHQYLLCSSLG